MAVSGHKSLSSLAIYERVSEKEKLAMGKALSLALNPNEEENVIPLNIEDNADAQNTTENLPGPSNKSPRLRTPTLPVESDETGVFSLSPYLNDLLDENVTATGLNIAPVRGNAPSFNHCKIGHITINVQINK